MIQFRNICLDEKIGVLIKTYEQKREFKKWLEKKISWSIDYFYFARPPFIVYPYIEKITHLRSAEYDRKDIIEPTEAIFPYEDVIIKEEQVKEVIEIDGVKYKRVEEEKPRGLYLEVCVTSGYLYIMYKGTEVGHISDEGYCFILDDMSCIEAYEQWREDGMSIDKTPIQWRGGTYQIKNTRHMNRTDISWGEIYDFDLCRASADCKDENIVRFKHNNRPVLF